MRKTYGGNKYKKNESLSNTRNSSICSVASKGCTYGEGREVEVAPEVGLEPTTRRLTAGCSTIELLWNSKWRRNLTTPLRRVNSFALTPYPYRYGWLNANVLGR